METLTLCTPWVDTWLPSLLIMDTLACVCKWRPSLSRDPRLLTLFAWAEQQSLDKSALWLAHVCEQPQRSSCLIRANSCAENSRSMRAHCGWLTSCEQSPRRRLPNQSEILRGHACCPRHNRSWPWSWASVTGLIIGRRNFDRPVVAQRVAKSEATLCQRFELGIALIANLRHFAARARKKP